MLLNTPTQSNPTTPRRFDDVYSASSLTPRSWTRDADGSDMEEYPAPLDTPGEVRGEYFA